MIPTTLLILALAIQEPAGWDATYQRGRQLLLDGKVAQAITLYEGAIKTYPTFDGAHFALAEAHRRAALEAELKGPAQTTARRQHLELAATHYRHAADRRGDYRQNAVGYLMTVLGPDELDRPNDVVPVARDYIEISPNSHIGYIALAQALSATGQEAAATSTFLRARTAIRPEGAGFFATTIIEYVIGTKTAAPADLKVLLEYAEGIVERELKEDPSSRAMITAKAAAASYRSQRLETDPARKRAAKAEADRLMDRLFALSRANATPEPPPANLKVPAPPPVPPPPPPGYLEADKNAHDLLDRKQFAAAAAIYEKFIKSDPTFPPPYYLRLQALLLDGQRVTIDAVLKTARAAVPATPVLRHIAGSYLFDIVQAVKTLSPAEARTLLVEAGTVLDEAIKLKPDYYEAVVYKSLVSRTRAKYETDPLLIKSLIAEAERLSAEAEKLRNRAPLGA